MPRRRLQPHISRIDQPRFFALAFGGIRPARASYASIKGTGEARRQISLLIILNQTARMLWLADRLKRVSRGCPALQIMFFMFAAEAVAKLFEGYEGERESKRFARQFFM
jgi:hypothetical protein